jgi:hypothetical protein
MCRRTSRDLDCENKIRSSGLSHRAISPGVYAGDRVSNNQSPFQRASREKALARESPSIMEYTGHPQEHTRLGAFTICLAKGGRGQVAKADVREGQ